MLRKILFLLFFLVSLTFPVQANEDNLTDLLEGEIVDFDLEILEEFLQTTITDPEDAQLVLLNLSYVAPEHYVTPQGTQFYGCGATKMNWINNTLTILCNAPHFTPTTEVGDLFTDCIEATGAQSCWGGGGGRDLNTRTYWQAQDTLADLPNFNVPWIVYMNPVAGQYRADNLDEFKILFQSAQ